MATAHGGGLMLVPVLLGMGSDHAAHAMQGMEMGMDMSHSQHAPLLQPPGAGALVLLAVVVVHAIALLVVAAAIALVACQWLELSVLRQSLAQPGSDLDITLVMAGLMILFV